MHRPGLPMGLNSDSEQRSVSVRRNFMQEAPWGFRLWQQQSISDLAAVRSGNKAKKDTEKTEKRIRRSMYRKWPRQRVSDFGCCFRRLSVVIRWKRTLLYTEEFNGKYRSNWIILAYYAKMMYYYASINKANRDVPFTSLPMWYIIRNCKRLRTEAL